MDSNIPTKQCYYEKAIELAVSQIKPVTGRQLIFSCQKMLERQSWVELEAY